MSCMHVRKIPGLPCSSCNWKWPRPGNEATHLDWQLATGLSVIYILAHHFQCTSDDTTYNIWVQQLWVILGKLNKFSHGVLVQNQWEFIPLWFQLATMATIPKNVLKPTCEMQVGLSRMCARNLWLCLLALLTFFYYYACKNDQLCSKILPQIDVTYTDKHITIHWHCIDNDSTCNVSDNSI